MKLHKVHSVIIRKFSGQNQIAIATRIQNLFNDFGNISYCPGVTQLTHALQCAQLAEDNGERSELIIACLLHDIGHLILNETPEMQRTINLKHEDIGANWLSQYFVSDVSEAVRYHVPAKRYLCGVDPQYWNNLTDDSKASLELQGGPMSAEEVSDFEKNPSSRDAAQLRRYDDLAKVANKSTRELSHFVPIIEEVKL